MRPRHRPVTTGLLAIVAAGITAAVLVIPVRVAAQERSITVGTRAEAWYRTLPTSAEGVPSPCDLPTGCGPAVPKPPAPLPSLYPAGTLHVGAVAGAEESRTYLTLDLSAVPADAVLTGGTLRLPIASDPNAGTAAPELAKVRVCDVPTFVRDGADGDLTGAPKVDCAVWSKATYVAGQGEQPAQLLVDLTPFVGLWSFGSGSVAVLPDKGLAPNDTWHVSFSGQDREAAGAAPISAQLELATVGPPDESPEDDGPGPLPGGDVAEGPAPPNDSFAPPPVEGGALTLDAGQSSLDASPPTLDAGASVTAQPQDPVSAPASGPGAVAAAPAAQPVVAVFAGHMYPAVFLLPLLVGLSVAWTGRAFTRDLQTARA